MVHLQSASLDLELQRRQDVGVSGGCFHGGLTEEEDPPRMYHSASGLNLPCDSLFHGPVTVDCIPSKT